MPISATWTNPSGGGALDLLTGSILTQTWVEAMASNFLYLAGTAGTFNSVVIGTGGLTITAGNLAVNTSIVAQYAEIIGGSTTAVAGSAIGLVVAPTLTAAATSDSLMGIEVIPTYTVAGHTGVNAYGILLQSVTSGATNNYGLYVAAPSGGSTANIGVYIAGGGMTVQAGGINVAANGINVTGTGVFNSAVTVGAGLTVTGDIIGTGDVYGPSGTTGATTGFIRISAANGAPTGAVSSVAGRAAIYYDASANQICVWNGVWKKTVALT